MPHRFALADVAVACAEHRKEHGGANGCGSTSVALVARAGSCGETHEELDKLNVDIRSDCSLAPAVEEATVRRLSAALTAVERSDLIASSEASIKVYVSMIPLLARPGVA